MITILNQTSRFLRISLSRGKVLRLGPRKEGQISTRDADLDTVKQLVADGAVFAGSGPLLYLVVHQYLEAGVRVAALLDTTAKSNWKAAISHLPGGLFRWDMLAKGRRWMKKIRQSGVLMVKGVTCGK